MEVIVNNHPFQMENNMMPIKKRRITEKYFKSWFKSMKNIYDNMYQDNLYNIYINKSITIDDMFHLFLIQMNFESKKVLNIDFEQSFTFGSIISTFDIFAKKKYNLNKKLIQELIPIIEEKYTNYDFIESSSCKLYMDKRNKIIYKEFDFFSLLDMVQETFIQKILYSYLPNNIGQIYGIFKNNSGDLKYIYSQTYFQDGTLFSNYQYLKKNQALFILINICEQLEILQKEVEFLHNDLKINNICIDIIKNQVYLIDFGYSSLVCNENLISGHLELHLEEFNKNKSLENFTKNNILTHETIIQDKYKYSSDLFYLIYTILYYYNSQFKNPIYDILYDLFNINDSIKGTINIFDKIYSLEHNSFEHAGFFMTKSHDLFIEYFGNNIVSIDRFYDNFLPENLSNYLQKYVEFTI